MVDRIVFARGFELFIIILCFANEICQRFISSSRQKIGLYCLKFIFLIIKLFFINLSHLFLPLINLNPNFHLCQYLKTYIKLM
jgi:hypothetical protein